MGNSGGQKVWRGGLQGFRERRIQNIEGLRTIHVSVLREIYAHEALTLNSSLRMANPSQLCSFTSCEMSKSNSTLKASNQTGMIDAVASCTAAGCWSLTIYRDIRH